VSRRHFDHDINFQILLEGEKVWRFEENRHIVNPLRSYHPGRLPDLFSEEAYAGDTSFSTEFDSARETRLTARPGSVVFFPRGYWHEVQSLTDTWSINFIVRGLPWSDAIGSALAARLKRMPQFREYHRFSTDSGHIESSSSFAQLQAEAIKALGEMNADEVTLSQLTVRYRWAETSSPRSVVVRDGRIELHLGADTPIEVEPALKPPLEKISGFQRSFSWHDALAVAGGIEPMGLYNLLEQLVEFGSLVKERRSPP
jgi:ribosomal protein L16 Arg81 hydroxylase